jgi:hypothetical protein
LANDAKFAAQSAETASVRSSDASVAEKEAIKAETAAAAAEEAWMVVNTKIAEANKKLEVSLIATASSSWVAEDPRNPSKITINTLNRWNNSYFKESRLKNIKLQTICGEHFIHLIFSSITTKKNFERNENDYYINFNIGGEPAHISFHKKDSKISKSGAFHIKLDDKTINVRLVLYKGPGDILQFNPILTTTEPEPESKLSDILKEILDIVERINNILIEENFKGEPSASASGGSPSYMGGGMRKNRSRRHKRQQKKRYTRRSK